MNGTKINDLPDVIDIKTLREFLHIGRAKTYDLIRKNEIKSRRIGRQYRILKKDVIDYMEGDI